jgi:hypothetical protein
MNPVGGTRRSLSLLTPAITAVEDQSGVVHGGRHEE